MEITVCFFENELIGKYVFGPTMTVVHPEVLLASSSPAQSASANSQIWHSDKGSPMKASKNLSLVWWMYATNLWSATSHSVDHFVTREAKL